jgi:hypothetical protein
MVEPQPILPSCANLYAMTLLWTEADASRMLTPTCSASAASIKHACSRSSPPLLGTCKTQRGWRPDLGACRSTSSSRGSWEAKSTLTRCLPIPSRQVHLNRSFVWQVVCQARGDSHVASHTSLVQTTSAFGAVERMMQMRLA